MAIFQKSMEALEELIKAIMRTVAAILRIFGINVGNQANAEAANRQERLNNIMSNEGNNVSRNHSSDFERTMQNVISNKKTDIENARYFRILARAELENKGSVARNDLLTKIDDAELSKWFFSLNKEELMTLSHMSLSDVRNHITSKRINHDLKPVNSENVDFKIDNHMTEEEKQKAIAALESVDLKTFNLIEASR